MRGRKISEAELETMVLTVVNAIPFGKKNAIKRDSLCEKVRMNDRKVRKMIELVR